MKDRLYRILQLAPAGLYGMLWIGGVSSYVVWGAPPENAAWTAPTFLWLAALIVMMAIPRGDRRLLGLCALLGFLIEVAGVHTGFPFGGYTYSNVLFPLVLGTPIVMGAAWIILLAYVRHLDFPREAGRLMTAAVCALWMVAIDLVIDPLAAGPLGYWTWGHPHGYYSVPWSNFGGWWLAAFLLLLIYPAPEKIAKPVLRVGLSTVLFFTVLSIVYRMWYPVITGLLLSLLHLLLSLKRSRRQQPHLAFSTDHPPLKNSSVNPAP
jgi:uncharacterized membrane protein